MSNYNLKAKDKSTGEVKEFTAMDDFYGKHQYGYCDNDGTVYDEDDFESYFEKVIDKPKEELDEDLLEAYPPLSRDTWQSKAGGTGTNLAGEKFTISGGKGGSAEPGDILFSNGEGSIKWREDIEEIITKRLEAMPNYEEYMVNSTMKVLVVKDINEYIKQVRSGAIEHCSEPRCPECQIAAYNRGKQDALSSVVEKIEKSIEGSTYSEGYMKAIDDVVKLIKEMI